MIHIIEAASQNNTPIASASKFTEEELQLRKKLRKEELKEEKRRVKLELKELKRADLRDKTENRKGIRKSERDEMRKATGEIISCCLSQLVEPNLL
jgi:hypothetical protein